MKRRTTILGWSIVLVLAIADLALLLFDGTHVCPDPPPSYYCQKNLLSLSEALEEYRSKHGRYPPGEGAEIIRALVRGWTDDSVDLDVRCPGLEKGDQDVCRWSTDYAGPSREALALAAQSGDPILFADLNEHGWNHYAERVVNAIRAGGKIEMYIAEWPGENANARGSTPIVVGPGSRIEALRDLRR